MKVIIPAVAEIDGEYVQVGDAETTEIPLRGFQVIDGALVAVLDINLED